ncbi:MAG: hypothetical protein JHC95_00180 [Solirubrobacteraceae bacterium]|nr:hypothetical protein [Solirubrobacteraceae bacterium]
MSTRSSDPRDPHAAENVAVRERSDTYDPDATLVSAPPASTSMGEIRARERAQFGGIAWGSTLLGWLSAAGIVALLAGILGATGAALALNEVGDDVTSDAETIGLAGGIGLLVVLAIGYYFGGYVAGRMARFDGARQGAMVWAWGFIAAIVIALLALIGGSEYNVLDQLNLPRVPVDEGTLTAGGIVALLGGFAVSLVAAVLGGKLGERFHRRVDRVGLADVRGVER